MSTFLKYDEVIQLLNNGCKIWTHRGGEWNLHPEYYIETPKGNFYIHFQTIEKLIRNKIIYGRNTKKKYRLIKTTNEMESKQQTTTNKSISQIAIEIVESEKKAAELKRLAEKKKLDKTLAQKLLMFENEFKQFLPALKKDGITWDAKTDLNRRNFFIEFKRGVKVCQMDFNNENSYRFEHPTGHGNMVFDKWLKTDFGRRKFVIWIYEKLFKE